MNKRIRMMIDELFADMKMTAENLALRDELMANAQARYEDALAQGRAEEAAFAEVAESLGGVQALLDEMNDAPEAAAEEITAEAIPKQEIPDISMDKIPAEGEPAQEEAKKEPQAEDAAWEQTQKEQPGGTDLGDALNKAFSALGDFSQAIMPEAKKLVREMDGASGGVLSKIGKATKKGLRDAQKAAEEAIDKLSGDRGELVFDFGPRSKKQEKDAAEEKDAAALREEAEALRAQAGIKDASGDPAGAQALRTRAGELDAQADALELKAAAEAARRAAQEAEEGTDKAQESEAAEPAEPLTDENGEVNEEALSRAVEEMAREAEEAVNHAKQAAQEAAREPEYIVRDASEPVSGGKRFPAAGLHAIEIKLDADDVEILAAGGHEVEVLWTANNADSEPLVSMEGHTLKICRRNPDVFKTFFSVFAKEGGKVTVRVPRGYGAAYAVSTTSGDVHIAGVDVGDVKAHTTSGCVRVEPDAAARAGKVEVTTVSGHATVSACADDVVVTTVSGDQFVSCDAHKADLNVVSGRVHAEGACDEWEVSAVSGDVEMLCTVAPTKKVEISAMHSTVRLALPGDIRGFAAQITGPLGCEIVNEFGPDRYGTCALPIRMETMRGKLMITRL